MEISYIAQKNAKRILEGEQVGNELARRVLWSAHQTAGKHPLSRFERGMYVGKLIAYEDDMGAEPWVVMSVENQIQMLPRERP